MITHPTLVAVAQKFVQISILNMLISNKGLQLILKVKTGKIGTLKN